MSSKRALGVVFLTIFLDLVGFGIIIPIQPFYTEVFGGTPTTVTLLGATYSLMQFLFAPFWGRLSDRVGRRPVVLVSVATSVVGFTLFGLAENLAMLFFARALAGFGNANIGTAQAIIADSTAAEDRAKGMGIVGAAFGLGFIFGPILGGVFGQVSLSLPAYVAAGLAAVNWVLAYFLLPETRRKGPAAPSRAHGGFFGLGVSATAIRRILHHVNVPHLLLLFFSVTLAFSQMEQVLGLFIERVWVGGAPEAASAAHPDLQRAAALTTYVLVAVGVTATIVQGRLIGVLARRFGEHRLIAAGTLVLALGLALIPLIGEAGTFALLVCDGVLLAIGTGITNPSLASLLSRSLDPGQQGAALGIGQSLAALGRVFGPLVAGPMFEAQQTLPFWVGAVLMLLCVVVALRLRRPAL